MLQALAGCAAHRISFPIASIPTLARKATEFWLHSLGEVMEFHLNCVFMGSGVEDNLFLLGKGLLGVDRQLIEIAERGHRSNVGVRKQLLEFVFRR